MRFYTARVINFHNTIDIEMLLNRVPTRPGHYSYRAKIHIGRPFADTDNETEYINDTPIEWDGMVKEFCRQKFFHEFVEVENIKELRF